MFVNQFEIKQSVEEPGFEPLSKVRLLTLKYAINQTSPSGSLTDKYVMSHIKCHLTTPFSVPHHHTHTHTQNQEGEYETCVLISVSGIPPSSYPSQNIIGN